MWIFVLSKSKRPFLLTCKVSRYYLLALHGSRPILGTIPSGGSSIVRTRRTPPPPYWWKYCIFMYFFNKVKLTPLFSAEMWLTPPPLAHFGSATASQQTRDVHPMSGQCWASVANSGPTLSWHWVDVSCLLSGIHGDWFSIHCQEGEQSSPMCRMTPLFRH